MILSVLKQCPLERRHLDCPIYIYIYIYIYIRVTNMKPYDYLKLKTIKGRLRRPKNSVLPTHTSNRRQWREKKMGEKGLLLCLFAVVILHCCAAKEEKSTWTWKSIQKIIDAIPKKILIGCGEQAVYGAVSRICTDFGSNECQSVVNNAWEAYHYYGLGTGTFWPLKSICTNLGDWLIQGVEAAAQFGWYGVRTTVWILANTAYYSGWGWGMYYSGSALSSEVLVVDPTPDDA